MRYRIRLVERGQTQELVVAGSSRAAAVAAARGNGRKVLSVEAVHDDASSRQASAGRFDITLFCEQLCTLLDAGLSLPEALHALHEKEEAPANRWILQAVLRELQVGRTFSDALQKVQGVFPDILVAAVRANERTANLSDALRRYSSYAASWRGLKRRLVTASVYPAVLLSIGVLVIVFLVSYVLPKFSAVYEGSGREMPALSQWLVNSGSWLHANGAIVVGALGSACVMLGALARSAAFRESVLKRMQQLPGIRSQMRLFRLARWLRTLGMLLSGGIPLVKALDMSCASFIGQERQRFDAARNDIQRGRQLSEALASHSLVTPLALSLIRVGERSGRLGDMLEQAARFHDEDVTRWIERTSRIVEPVLMAFIGIVVGGVVITMYMPIFDLAGGLR